MAELRAGGLAIVVGGKQNTPLIGRVVQLERLEQSESWVRIAGQPLFFNEMSARWLVIKPGLKMQLSNGSVVNGYALILPQHLMPIDGDAFRHEDEQQKELMHG